MKSIEVVFVRNDEDVWSSGWVEYGYRAKGAGRSEIRLQDLAPERRR